MATSPVYVETCPEKQLILGCGVLGCEHALARFRVWGSGFQDETNVEWKD